MVLPTARCIQTSELVAAKDPSKKLRTSSSPSRRKSTLMGQVAGALGSVGGGTGGIAVTAVLGAAVGGVAVTAVLSTGTSVGGGGGGLGLALSAGVGSFVMMKDRSEYDCKTVVHVRT